MSRSREPISALRKGADNLGCLIMLIGLLMVGSAAFMAIEILGDSNEFVASARSFLMRAILGMALLIVGGLVRGLGARGLAGSEVLLDPDRARDDLSP